jgi:hypothetical protein
MNESWSLHFKHDALYSGKRFRTLNVLNEGVRECLSIEVCIINITQATPNKKAIKKPPQTYC